MEVIVSALVWGCNALLIDYKACLTSAIVNPVLTIINREISRNRRTAGRAGTGGPGAAPRGARRALAAALAALPAGLAAAAPVPPWSPGECPVRVVFAPPPRPAVQAVVRIPSDGRLGTNSVYLACDGGGAPAACRAVHVDDEAAEVLVALRAGDARPYVVYAGPPDALATNAPPVPPPPYPSALPAVGVDLRAIGAAVPPERWTEFLYLFRRVARPATARLETSLRFTTPAVDSESLRGRREAAPPGVARRHTWLRCPADGLYRFSLVSDETCFLLVDGALLGEWPDGAAVDRAATGPSAFLRAGLHELQLFHTLRRGGETQVLWWPPGVDAAAPIPADALVAAHRVAAPRVERIDRTLHPDFVPAVGAAYRFRNAPGDFVAVRLVQNTADWLDGDLRFAWTLDDGRRETGREPTVVLDGRRVHRVRLDVRDGLGFAASCEREIDARLEVPVEYAVSAELTDLPPAAFAPDDLSPVLTIHGATAPDVPLDVDWTATLATRREESTWKQVTPDGRARSLPLGQWAAGSLAALSWSVSHRGRPIAAQTVDLVRPPFARLPARFRGEAMLDADGRAMVLVPHREWGRTFQAPLATRQIFGRLLCIDDSLALPGPQGLEASDLFHAVLGRLLDGPAYPIVRLNALPQGAEISRGAPETWLALAQAPAAVNRWNPDTVILSLGLRDIVHGTDPPAFERRAAALSDLIAGATGKPMLWATPPPFPPSPARARPYALAVRRVAEARQIPVADLYSAFLGAGDAERLFERGGVNLSREGHELAGRVMARALLAAVGEAAP